MILDNVNGAVFDCKQKALSSCASPSSGNFCHRVTRKQVVRRVSEHCLRQHDDIKMAEVSYQIPQAKLAGS